MLFFGKILIKQKTKMTFQTNESSLIGSLNRSLRERRLTLLAWRKPIMINSVGS